MSRENRPQADEARRILGKYGPVEKMTEDQRAEYDAAVDQQTHGPRKD